MRLQFPPLIFQKERGAFSVSSAILGVVLTFAVPCVVIQDLWTSELSDRAATVLLVAFLVALGAGAWRHAFIGTPIEEIGE